MKFSGKLGEKAAIMLKISLKVLTKSIMFINL